MKKLLVTLVLALPFMAFAKEGAGTGSEYFYQAGAGTNDITGRLTNSATNVEFVGGETDTSSTSISAEYERGLTDMFSVGVLVSYSTGSTETTVGAFSSESDSKGLEDLEVLFKGVSPMGSGNLRYGATLGYALGNQEVESNGDTNNFTGGSELTPYVGYEWLMDPCTFGVKVSRDLELQAETSETGGTETETEGGESTTLALFYEHKFNETVRLGAEFVYTTLEDTESGGVTSEALSPLMGLRVYVPVSFSVGTLLPEVTYATSNDDESAGVELDSVTAVGLSVGYRVAF